MNSYVNEKFLYKEKSAYKSVTFFFSDIEGSTRLLQKLGDKYSGLLELQQQIIKEEFRSFRGEMLDMSGDGFFAVFENVKDAVECAVSIQKRIFNQQWADNSEVKIRMGIHSGEAKVSLSGYTGIDVHRAARIMASGHGGQVLISESSKELVEKELTSGISLKFLGEHFLKDLQNPERIYQLVIEGLNSDFPEISTLSSGKTNLPSNIVRLVGRDTEMHTLKEMLLDNHTRLVTISGPGGIGKTSLALNVAGSLMNFFRDGVYCVLLSTLNKTDLVPSTIGKALGLSESNNSADLISFLENKNILLLLDNFEQVIDASEIINEIISNCPEVKMLITSRILLHVQAEREFPLNSLSLPEKRDFNDPRKILEYDSVKLFAERARNIDPNFKITSENSEAIAKICIQLDGLPLAIELACARIKLFSPNMLLSRLSDKLNLLKGFSKDLPERHQTLRHTILWSYELLSEEEKKLFEELSVFRGGCTLDAIVNVCGDFFRSELELFDAVQALVDKSLLRRVYAETGEPRFTMLFTIREFSRELFEKSDNYNKVNEKHANYYLTKSEEAEPFLTGMEVRYWSDMLNVDIDNYRSALSWSVSVKNSELALRLSASLWRFWIIRRNLKEGLERMKDVLSMPYTDDQLSLRAKVLFGIGTLSHELNDYETSLPIIEESVKIYDEIGDENGKLDAMINLFWVKIHLGMLDEAEGIADECLKMIETLKNERAYSLIYNNLGWLYFARGNLLRTKDFYLKSLDKRKLVSDRRGEGFAYINLAWVETVLGNFNDAEEQVSKAIEIMNSISDKQLSGWGSSIYSLLEFSRGNFESAEKHIVEAINKMKESLHEWGISYETLLYGLIKYYSNEKSVGIKNIEKGLSFYRKIKNKWGVKRALAVLGAVYFDIGDIGKSKSCFKEALEITIDLNDRLGFVQVFEGVAIICLKEEKINEAKKFYQAAEKIRNDINAPMNFTELLVHEKNIKELKIETPDKIDIEKVSECAFEVLE